MRLLTRKIRNPGATGKVKKEEKPNESSVANQPRDPVSKEIELWHLKSHYKKNSKSNNLLDKLTKEDIENYKTAFSLYDKNKNGTIEENELLAVMRTLGENPTEDQMTFIMHEMDTDGNGKIDFEEFLQSMAAKRMMRDSMEDLRMAFQVFDQNGDGKISTDELMSTMTELTGTMSVEEAREFLREADSDGNGFIDYEEFVALISNGPASSNE